MKTFISTIGLQMILFMVLQFFFGSNLNRFDSVLIMMTFLFIGVVLHRIAMLEDALRSFLRESHPIETEDDDNDSDSSNLLHFE